MNLCAPWREWVSILFYFFSVAAYFFTRSIKIYWIGEHSNSNALSLLLPNIFLFLLHLRLFRVDFNNIFSLPHSYYYKYKLSWDEIFHPQTASSKQFPPFYYHHRHILNFPIVRLCQQGGIIFFPYFWDFYCSNFRFAFKITKAVQNIFFLIFPRLGNLRHLGTP